MVVSAPVTTYEGISTMTCATGYEGTAANITCTDAGTWSTQTGCTIAGKFSWHHCNYCGLKKTNARILLVSSIIGHIYEVNIARYKYESPPSVNGRVSLQCETVLFFCERQFLHLHNLTM